jgi:hypothetical protein
LELLAAKKYIRRLKEEDSGLKSTSGALERKVDEVKKKKKNWMMITL